MKRKNFKTALDKFTDRYGNDFSAELGDSLSNGLLLQWRIHRKSNKMNIISFDTYGNFAVFKLDESYAI